MDFDEFARQRLPALVGFAAAMCADRGLAEDVVQEVLIRVADQWGRIGQLDAPERYVRRALVNEYLSWRRKWARIVPHATPPMGDGLAPDFVDEHVLRSGLVAELAALPARQRTVLVMRYYGGMTDQEIAEILGCRPATVRGYASRALAALRVVLTEQVDIESGSHHAN